MPSGQSGDRDQNVAAPRDRRGRGGRERRRGRPGDSGRGTPPPTEVWDPRDVVFVAFRGGRIEPYLNQRGLAVRTGDHVLVEAERGQDLGRVVTGEHQDSRPCKGPAPRKLLRHATAAEHERWRALAQEDRSAFDICRERAEHFDLSMKMIDAETQFDGNRVTFYFTAEKRVDFRELVRDLASIFRTRIELRQVGARDAARRCDGIGLCGRQLCCTTFLREFEPVTLKMAKEQQLSLNPTKISGACGRLMCCLTYECAAYQDAMRRVPPVGSRWCLDGATWFVRNLDVGNHRIFLAGPDDQVQTIDIERFRAEAELIEREAPRPPVATPVADDAPEATAEAPSRRRRGARGGKRASRGSRDHD